MDWALVWEDPHKSRSVQGTQGEGHLGLRADLKQYIYIYTHVGVYVFVSYMCDHTRAACHRSQTENMCLIERSLWKALRAKRWHFVSHCKPLCYHSTGQQTPGIEDLTPGLLNHVTVIMFLANLLDLCWTLMGQYFLNGSCQKLTFRTHS